MIKIRMTGLSEEIQNAIKILKNSFEIFEVSNEYPNRNSQYVRIYIECEPKQTDVHKIIVLDTETTGINYNHDEILQLSVIDSNGATLYNSYFKPQHTTNWTQAQSINGISPETVANAPNIAEEREKINEILCSADVIVGYNTNFDLNFLFNAGCNINPKTKVVDVMQNFAEIYGEWSEYHNSYKWQSLIVCANYYGYDWGCDTAHDSLADCRATLFCYNKMEE